MQHPPSLRLLCGKCVLKSRRLALLSREDSLQRRAWTSPQYACVAQLSSSQHCDPKAYQRRNLHQLQEDGNQVTADVQA